MRVVAQPVLDRLVLKQRVEDVGAGAQAGLERRRDGLSGFPAVPAVGMEQVRQRHVERDRLLGAGRLDPDRRGQLVEQARPRPPAGDPQLGRDRLLGLGQQVRAVAALHAQVVGGELEPLGGEQLLGAGVVHLHPLELEEEQFRLDRGGALAHHLHQRPVGGFLGVGREAQVGEAGGPAGQLRDCRQLRHRIAQVRAVELADLALVEPREGSRALIGAIEQRRDGRLVAARRCVGVGLVDLEQMTQVPGDGLQRAHAPASPTGWEGSALSLRRST